MEETNLTPEKSLALISQVIGEAKSQIEENGFIYAFWGVLTAVASFSQFFLLQYEYYDINYYPYFLMPLGILFSWYYASKKTKRKGNQLNKVIAACWIILSFNMMLLGFVFAPSLRQNLMPIILILLASGIFISGVTIKSKLLMFSGIIINISAIISFTIGWLYQPLLTGVVSLVAVLIPGIILMIQHKKKQDV